jgi:hypothetical protein
VAEAQRDIWSRWLLERRFGGAPQQRRAMLHYLLPVRDKVLDLARLGEGGILPDVGCGRVPAARAARDGPNARL